MNIANIRPRIGQKIETQEGLPADHVADSRSMVAGMLAQDAAEASRMAYAGRSIESLKEARTFDEARLEAAPLFENAKRQQQLF
jgi:hypothetical protein